MRDVRQWLRHLVLISSVVGSLAPIYLMAQEAGSILPSTLIAEDPKLVYRMDLMTGKLDPIDRSDLKVGYVYYHFSSRRNHWVWSYYQKDGSFWYAFGEGTTQEAWCFDIRASREELSKRLEEFPQLAHQLERQNHSVCLRLQADGRWKIIQSGIPRSIFNAETGERWQMFAKDEYTPVVHTGGNRWTARNGDYYATNSYSSGQ
jgi:hypothetical protein